MSVVDGKRMPCESCGRRLYYHEQRQRFCYSCATVLGIKRISDRGSPPLLINGKPVEAGPRYRPPPATPPPPRKRIFDHFTGGEPEDDRFSRVAHEMRSSAWWSTPPQRDEPATTSGEVTR